MVSGGIAGAVSRTATSPVERLKVLQQVQVSGVKTYSGIVGGLNAIYRTEGWKGYFKGNGSNVARIAPYSALQFLFFDWSKILVQRVHGDKDERGKYSYQLNSVERFCSGAFAGTASTLFCYPLDLVRSLLTVQTNQGKYNGIIDCLRKVHQAEGVRGLFRGSIITMAGITPYIAINFYTFDSLKQQYLPKDKNDPSFIWINLLLGAIAGGTAALLTYPSDVVRRRIQLLGSGSDMVQGMVGKPTIAACVRAIVQKEGVPGLYKGLNACLLKVMPSMAISFTIHEQLRHRLNFKVEA
jgi:solute carrier family 25 phosphate transporter 23/24/25/41